jgi:hypothetical protein
VPLHELLDPVIAHCTADQVEVRVRVRVHIGARVGNGSGLGSTGSGVSFGHASINLYQGDQLVTQSPACHGAKGWEVLTELPGSWRGEQ